MFTGFKRNKHINKRRFCVQIFFVNPGLNKQVSFLQTYSLYSAKKHCDNVKLPDSLDTEHFGGQASCGPRDP